MRIVFFVSILLSLSVFIAGCDKSSDGVSGGDGASESGVDTLSPSEEPSGSDALPPPVASGTTREAGSMGEAPPSGSPAAKAKAPAAFPTLTPKAKRVDEEKAEVPSVFDEGAPPPLPPLDSPETDAAGTEEEMKEETKAADE